MLHTGNDDADTVTRDLNALGADGWELVATDQERTIFRRQLPPGRTSDWHH